MSGHQARFDAARQRAADARHNAEEYQAKATAALQAAVDAESQARLIAREAWRRGLGVLETRPVRTWPMGRLAGYKPPQTAPAPTRECDLCGAEVTGVTCSECSTELDTLDREALDAIKRMAEAPFPGSRTGRSVGRLSRR